LSVTKLHSSSLFSLRSITFTVTQPRSIHRRLVFGSPAVRSGCGGHRLAKCYSTRCLPGPPCVRELLAVTIFEVAKALSQANHKYRQPARLHMPSPGTMCLSVRHPRSTRRRLAALVCWSATRCAYCSQHPAVGIRVSDMDFRQRGNFAKFGIFSRKIKKKIKVKKAG